MARPRPFAQVDVFGARPYAGNPVAVVLDAEGLDDAQLQRVAHWTNLSETTFVLPPSDAAADYRVRIFTPSVELPFAGHPTLGTCHAWLEAGGAPQASGRVVQECGVGLVPVRATADGHAFAAPPLTRSGPPTADELTRACAQLGLREDDVAEAAWVVNGPEWLALLLPDVAAVRAVRPPGGDFDMDLGVVAIGDDGPEVRAFFPTDGAATEDPVTGSLNAGLAVWLTGSGRLAAPYVARQGGALGRDGRVHVTQDGDGALWVAGATMTCVRGEITL